MVRGGPIPLLSTFKFTQLMTMHKSIEVVLHYLFLDDNDEPEFHRAVDLDPRISKQISLNYAACSSLIEVTEKYTEYKYVNLNGEIRIFHCSGHQEVIWIKPNEIRMYNWGYIDSKTGFSITRESYERIYKLCNDLIDKINDSFR